MSLDILKSVAGEEHSVRVYGDNPEGDGLHVEIYDNQIVPKMGVFVRPWDVVIDGERYYGDAAFDVGDASGTFIGHCDPMEFTDVTVTYDIEESIDKLYKVTVILLS